MDERGVEEPMRERLDLIVHEVWAMSAWPSMRPEVRSSGSRCGPIVEAGGIAVA